MKNQVILLCTVLGLWAVCGCRTNAPTAKAPTDTPAWKMGMDERQRSCQVTMEESSDKIYAAVLNGLTDLGLVPEEKMFAENKGRVMVNLEADRPLTVEFEERLANVSDLRIETRDAAGRRRIMQVLRAIENHL